MRHPSKAKARRGRGDGFAVTMASNDTDDADEAEAAAALSTLGDTRLDGHVALAKPLPATPHLILPPPST